MRFQLTIGEEQTILEPTQPFTDGEGVQHPSNVLTLWSDEELAAIGVEKIADGPAPVPAEVPMYKVRKFLIKEGLMPTVQAALDAMPGEAGELARVDFEYAPNLVRAAPLVQGVGAAVGLTSEEIDAMLIAAEALA